MYPGGSADTEDVRRIRELLQQKNLLKIEDTPTLVTHMETDQSELTNPSLSNQSEWSRHVDLWPLSDHMTAVSELRLVNDWLSSCDRCNQEEIGALVHYGAQFTPLSPSALHGMKALTEDKSKVRVVQ